MVVLFINIKHHRYAIMRGVDIETEQQPVAKIHEKPIVNKKKRGRKAGAIQFPQHTLNDALSVAKVIWEHGENNSMRLMDIGNYLGKGPKTLPFRTLIRSSHRYGLTDGLWNNDISRPITLTELGESIVAPTAGENTTPKKSTALQNPEVFRTFFNHIKGTTLPSPEEGKNTLVRVCHIARDEADLCYSVSLIFQMLELVKGAVIGIFDLKTKTAKYRSVICIIWSVPKRKIKRKAKPSLLKTVPKWDHYWFLCRYSPILQPLLKC